MKNSLLAATTIVAVTIASPALSAPGDVYVPAHRTSSGHWVPANVPPSSGGTRMVRKLAPRPAQPVPVATAAAMPPLFVSAAPIRR